MGHGVNQVAHKMATVLLIDDEPNILAALQRLLHPFGYSILEANSGAEGLSMMTQHSVDLVICDMRMPEIEGTEVLENIRLKWPDTIRILLTGYTDLQSTIAAINRGEIYRYLAKPWDDNDVILMVRDALEHKRLLAEKRALEKLTARQNEELKTLNANLETRVLQRTEDLYTALEHLQKDYLATIHIFSNLLELRKGKLAGHSRRVAQLCRNLAVKMNLPETDIQAIETAALLHNIGKLSLPDHLLEKPYLELSVTERAEFDKHPLHAAAALMALEPLRQASAIIRHHRESYDGTGNPSGLRGAQLPIGSRILSVASDFEGLQLGLLARNNLAPEQALEIVILNGKRYDPDIVNALRNLAPQTAPPPAIASEYLVTSDQLRAGVSLRQDIVTSSGVLLLLKDTVLGAKLIQDIRDYERTTGEQLTIYTSSI